MADSVRAKFTPFPRIKRIKGQRGPVEVDLEKIKEMYVSGGHLRWTDFCRANNFHPGSADHSWFRSHVDWESWKMEWVRRKNAIAQEDITPQMVDCTKMIAEQRIRFVQDWVGIAKNMKSLLVHLLNQHIEDAAWDQQNKLAIRAGQAQRRTKLNIEELSQFGAAEIRIQELESRALLFVAESKSTGGTEEEYEPKADDKIPEFEIYPMGEKMSSHERTKLLANYFDQIHAVTPALPAPKEKDVAQDPS